MRVHIIAMTALLGPLICSCSTTSFAPPVVDLSTKTQIDWQPQRTCVQAISSGHGDITQNVDGARSLIDNFIYIYRCQSHSAANGRQAFEIPQLLAAAGGAIASAYGAGANVAIGVGGAGAILATGKNYYDPKQKAAVYDHALDALLCIKTEAVGIAPFTVPVAQLSSTGSTVSVSADHRYFDMVTAALLSVERILSQRLSSTGTFDTAGLIAEIEAIKWKIDDAQAKKSQQASPTRASSATPAVAADAAQARTPPNAPTSEASKSSNSELQYVGTPTDNSAAMAALLAQGRAKGADDYSLDLEILQPKLQQCVIRAKL